MDDNLKFYIYRYHLLGSLTTLTDVNDALEGYEYVVGKSHFSGSFEQYVARCLEIAVDHIREYSGLFDNPEQQLAQGYLKNSDELQSLKNLVDALKAVLDNVYFDERIFPDEWSSIVEAAQAALDIFDPYYPYTQDTIPDEARQFGAEQPHSPIDMDAERWLMSDLGFGDTDLRQNRELGLSEAQKMRLQRKHDEEVRCAMIATGAVIGIALTIGWLVFLFVDYRAVFICIPLILIAVAFGIFAMERGRTKVANLTVTKVIAVVGDPDPSWGPYWQSAMLSLAAEGQPLQMKVPKRYFTKGDRYRLYYVYENKKILSAEKISDGAR